MLSIQRDRPTFQRGEYLQITINTYLKTLASQDWKVINGVHSLYLPEAECPDCGHYFGDDWEEGEEWMLRISGHQHIETFFLVLLESRTEQQTEREHHGEDHRTNPEGGTQGTDQAQQETASSEAIEAAIRDVVRSSTQA